jgi:Histidine kinase/Y_Y_Y domain
LNFYDRQRDIFIPIKFGKNLEFNSYPYCVDNQGLVWINIFDTKQDGLYTFDTKSKVFQLITNKQKTNFVVPDNQPLHEVRAFYCAADDDKGFQKISFEKNKETKSETFFDGKDKLPTLNHIGDYLCVENDTTIWITNVQNSLMKFNPRTKKYKYFDTFEGQKLGLIARVVLYKDYLIIGSIDGVYVFDRKKEAFVQKIKRSATNQNGLMNDYVEIPYISDDNLFLSQLGPGVDFTNLNRVLVEQWFDAEMVLKLGFSKNIIGNIVQYNNQIWFASEKLFIIDQNGKFIQRLPFQNPLISDSQNRIWTTNGKFLKWYNAKTNQSRTYNFKELGQNESWQLLITEIDKDHYILASTKGLFELNDATQTLRPFTEFNQKNWDFISPIYFDKISQQLFISTNWWGNFSVLKKVKNEWILSKKTDAIKNVYAIKPAIDSSKIWLCTRNGLIKIDKQSLDYQLFTEKNGLPENFVSDILEIPNGNHWLVTGKGISYYDKAKKEYYQFSSKDGAYSKEYRWGRGFLLADGRAVFGGTNGITVINPTTLKNYVVKPKIQITQLLIDEKTVKNQVNIGEASSIELEANQNSFALEVVGIEYGFPENLKIQYQLQGIDKQWITASNPTTLRYSNLPDGSLELWIRATDESGKTSSEIKKIGIIINAPFYRTVWFRLLLLFTFVVLGYLIYRIRIARIREEAKKKEEIRRIKAEAEINVLRSQMNPHFIFNCLNTVDSYILTNKTDEASDFLNKFSKLIRLILENSRQEFIPIEQDLKALELYLKLEKERSFPQFNFQIVIDENLDETVYFIPSMLIQPFVENAILHGLRHQKNKIGELSISLKSNAKNLIISILDNGIGREASAKINANKTSNKQSVGIKLTEERIQKMNEIFDGNASLKVNDLASGTEVVISLPLLTEQNIQQS